MRELPTSVFAVFGRAYFCQDKAVLEEEHWKMRWENINYFEENTSDLNFPSIKITFFSPIPPKLPLFLYFRQNAKMSDEFKKIRKPNPSKTDVKKVMRVKWDNFQQYAKKKFFCSLKQLCQKNHLDPLPRVMSENEFKHFF
jgi:hypothetical protein